MTENTCKRIYKILGTIIVIAIILYVGWRFSNIVLYIFISGVLSLVGQPLIRIFDKMSIGKFRFPHTLSTILTFLIMITVFVGLFSIFVPIVVRQATAISDIDINEVTRGLNEPLQKIKDLLVEYNILESNETIETTISKKLQSFINLSSVSNIFTDVMTITGSLLMGIFSILFITFFFLHERHLFYDGIMLFIPERYKQQTSVILSDSRRLLFRYFIGLMIEVMSMITIISTTLALFGVKSAFLIGFLGGLTNIIPYLGPIIGTAVGVVLGSISYLGTVGEFQGLWIVVLTIVITFAGANLIDNIFLQPWIYSTSVKAHPLEIFLVFLVAGTLAGPLGMILAIPSYTVIRIIAKQFFTNSAFIEKITRNI